MYLGHILIRFTTIVAFINMCVAEKAATAPPRKEKRLGKYPSKVHDLYQNQIEKKPKLIGEWSVWSPWSPCSRTCGGGVTQQIRHCINRPADSRFVKRQRRRSQNWKPSNECVGLYKRIHLCNTQDCPGDRDFRYEQCAAFNNRPFKGRTHYWEPFYQAKAECVLNCRPRGMNFYATLNKTLIDGTPCHHPITSTGKAAPKGTRGVCIDGYCKSVNTQGVVGGSDDNGQQECFACLRGACRSVNGIYTRPDLPSGYSLVAQIPRSACGLHIQQLKHTRNLLALKLSNGSYILNGDWKFGASRSVEAAGTRFTYIKQDSTSLETISAPGPLAASIDIMIVNYQANPGIKYGYSLSIDEVPIIAPPLLKRPSPSDQPSLDTRTLDIFSANSTFNNQRDEAKPATVYPGQRRTRLRRRYFHWKVTGLTPCTKSCGGGTQTYIRACYRTVTAAQQIPVNEKRCAHLDSPALAPIACNVEPCNAFWDGGWGQCSVSCGEGIQQFIPQCKEDVNGKLIVISEAQCPKPKPSPQSRACQERECDYFKGLSDNELPQTVEHPTRSTKKDWTVGVWSQCSVTCGTGHRTRSVICPSGQCHPENRPAHAEYCNQGTCDNTKIETSQTQHKPLVSSSSSHSISFSLWLVTEWSHCSEKCGTGNQTRFAVCEHDYCSSESKPEISRECSSEKHCDGQWFAGPWGECSDSCNGPARQKREILCIAKIRGVAHVTNEMICPITSKPYEEQSCYGICPPQWFTGDWGKCEGNCPAGIQKREVRCLDIDKRPSNRCSEDKMPVSKRSCTCETYRESKDNPIYKFSQDEPIDRSCVDRISKCRLAVQARLCHYPYYMKNCCDSCKRQAQQDLIE